MEFLSWSMCINISILLLGFFLVIKLGEFPGDIDNIVSVVWLLLTLTALIVIPGIAPILFICGIREEFEFKLKENK